MNSLQAPVNVSPVVKFARWSLLFCGIIYGWNKKAVLERLEVKERVLRREAIERRLRNEKMKTKRTYIELLVFFGGIFDMEFPPNWEPPQ